MRLLLIAAMLWSLLVPGASAAGSAPALDFVPHTETLLLVDRDTGETLYGQNADVVRPIASLTKIMTYIVTVEAVEDLEGTEMKVEAQPLKTLEGRGASTCGLEDRVGDSLPVLEVLYGLMLPSGCDAGAELAWFVGNGDMQAFVDRMNAKAAELGCTDTHYVDAHGLSRDNQSTARDLCKIAEYAMTVPRFWEIVNTPSHWMTGADGPVYNSNSIMNPVSGGRYYNRYVHGIKTGYTYEAGRCLISTASKGERNFLCVALGGDYSEDTGYVNNAMLDTNSLYSWAFENFTDNVEVEIGPRFTSLQLEESETLKADISGGDENAQITWTSSAPDIASVGPDGTVTAHKLGEAVITAESETGNLDTCTVSCGYYRGIELSGECGDYTSGEKQPISWEAVSQAGLDFVMLRAGWGSEDYPDQNDAALVDNITGAVNAGIPFGLRFVSYADSPERAQAEAAYFLREVDEVIPQQIAQMSLPVVYDLSDAGFQELEPQTCTDIVLAFAQALGERGLPVMVCSGSAVFEGMDLEALDQAGVGLWYRYTPYEPDFSSRVRISGTTVPTMWQYRSNLALPGATESNGRVRESLYYMTTAWNEDRTAPEITATLSEDEESVTLQWTAGDETCSGYRVWRQMESSNVREEIATVDAGTLTFEDGGHPGERCIYTVTALYPDPLDPEYQGGITSGEETVQFAEPSLLAQGADFLEDLDTRLGGRLPLVLGACGAVLCLLIAFLLLRFLVRSLHRRRVERPTKQEYRGRQRGRREADRRGRRRS